MSQSFTHPKPGSKTMSEEITLKVDFLVPAVPVPCCFSQPGTDQFVEQIRTILVVSFPNSCPTKSMMVIVLYLKV
jgi:hypothetical protein